jgi:hypothetical protein
MILTSSSKRNLRVSIEDEEYIDDFHNGEEDDWKSKKKKERGITKTNKSKKKER